MAASLIKNEKGFFFLAMIVVILATSIAAGIAFMNLAPSISTNSVSITYDKAEKLRAAITKYQLNHGGAAGSFPTTLMDLVTDSGLACSPETTAGPTYLTLQGWCGPYLDIITTNDAAEFMRDGWGSNFLYATGTFRSFGPNKVDNGGTGDDLVFSP